MKKCKFKKGLLLSATVLLFSGIFIPSRQVKASLRDPVFDEASNSWVYSFDLPAKKASNNTRWWTTAFEMTGTPVGRAGVGGINVPLGSSSGTSDTTANYQIPAGIINQAAQQFCQGQSQTTVYLQSIISSNASGNPTFYDPNSWFTCGGTNPNGYWADKTIGNYSAHYNIPMTLHTDADLEYNGHFYPGYGCANYGKYTKSLKIKFSFPVIPIFDDTGTGEGQTYEYYDANQWINLPVDQLMKKDYNMTFYVPAWVGETKDAKISAKAIAINAGRTGSGSGKSNPKHNDIEPKLIGAPLVASSIKNRSDIKLTVPDHTATAATDSATIALVGRLYGFKILDVGDYPSWQNYFRNDKDLLTGNAYYSGVNNENGKIVRVSNKYTVPSVNGSHPSIANAGVQKPGYVTRFSVESIGPFADAKDYVCIKPTFYYVKKGSNTEVNNRQEVSVYYDETFNGKKHTYVLAGGELDKTNKHSLSLRKSRFIADDKAENGAKMSDLRRTLQALGKSTSFFQYETPVWTTKNIMINQRMRVLAGNSHKVKLTNGNTLDLGIIEEQLEKDSSVQPYEITSSVQDWYSTYYLPSNLHVKKKANKDPSIITDPSSVNWLGNDGYLIVNFKIYVLDSTNDSEPEFALNYDASKLYGSDDDSASMDTDQLKQHGYCNMWKIEGYQLEKTSNDRYQTKFNFNYGDVIVYDLGGDEASDDPNNPNGSTGASGDYSSGGTH